MTANGIAHARFKLRRTGIVVGLVLPLLALANPPPLIPPLPSGALPGGAQPIVPPPIMPLPQTNLQIDIPPLAERPLRGSEGARVFVRRFVISGVIGDRPAGIIPAAVQAVVDARFARLEALVNSKRKLLQGRRGGDPKASGRLSGAGSPSACRRLHTNPRQRESRRIGNGSGNGSKRIHRTRGGSQSGSFRMWQTP